MNTRKPIPEDIKREVRQRCGFGCVICGMPLYEYDHMLGYSVERGHIGREITLLCRQHHGEKTNALLPLDKVIAADADPYNGRTGVSKNVLLHYAAGRNLRVRIADSVFECQLSEGEWFAPLIIDAHRMLCFFIESGNLLLDLVVHDTCNKRILAIQHNALVYDTSQWDIEWVGQTLTIREAHRRILLQLVFNPPEEITIRRGRIMYNGVEILVGPDYFYLTNKGQFFSNHTTTGLRAPLAIGDPHPPVAVAHYFPAIPRLGIDLLESRRHLRKCLTQIRAGTP